MPSTSPKQARTMAAVAHGWKPPASSGINIPTKVAKDYNKADKGTAMLARGMRKHNSRSTGGTTFGTAIGGGTAGGGAGGGS